MAFWRLKRKLHSASALLASIFLLTTITSPSSAGAQPLESISQLPPELVRGLRASQLLLRELQNTGVWSVLLNQPRQALQDSPQKATDALKPFEGQWVGKWHKQRVIHDWQALTLLAQPILLGKQLEILAIQFCWVGDGYGWNVVVRKGGQVLLLGTVNHLDPSGRIAYRVPHVGVPRGAGHILWMTPSSLFSEYINDGKYVIQSQAWKMTTDVIELGQSYQTTYQRLKAG